MQNRACQLDKSVGRAESHQAAHREDAGERLTVAVNGGIVQDDARGARYTPKD